MAYQLDTLLICVGEERLEVYNTAAVEQGGDNAQIETVFKAWEWTRACPRPRNHNILAIFQRNCLRQDNITLKWLVKRARRLIDDGDYEVNATNEYIGSVVAVRMKPNEARRDVIAAGWSLTFN